MSHTRSVRISHGYTAHKHRCRQPAPGSPQNTPARIYTADKTRSQRSSSSSFSAETRDSPDKTSWRPPLPTRYRSRKHHQHDQIPNQIIHKHLPASVHSRRFGARSVRFVFLLKPRHKRVRPRRIRLNPSRFLRLFSSIGTPRNKPDHQRDGHRPHHRPCRCAAPHPDQKMPHHSTLRRNSSGGAKYFQSPVSISLPLLPGSAANRFSCASAALSIANPAAHTAIPGITHAPAAHRRRLLSVNERQRDCKHQQRLK